MQDKLGSIDSLMSEIYGVVAHAAESGREHLTVEEIEYIKRITKRMIKETKMESSKIALLLPEEIPQEIVVQILKRGAN